MDLEGKIANVNSEFFLREFTFSSTKIRDENRQETEFCDGAVWLQDLLLVFQIKQRNPSHAADPETEAKWYDKKVNGIAVGQIAHTRNQLAAGRSIPLFNQRGQQLDIGQRTFTSTHNLVVFSDCGNLDDGRLYRKGRITGRAGFVHFMHDKNYHAVCATLFTPREIFDYFDFRERIIRAAPESANAVTEKALVGKYLSGDETLPVADDDEHFVNSLVDTRSSVSIRSLLAVYLDRAVIGAEGYQRLIAELAMLRRGPMGEFRQRLLWAMDECKKPSPARPSRMCVPYLDCSFVFIPLSSADRPYLRTAVENYTKLNKYDFRSQKGIGCAVAPDAVSGNQFLVQWYFVEHNWVENPLLQKVLDSDDVFRPIRVASIGGYQFQSEQW